MSVRLFTIVPVLVLVAACEPSPPKVTDPSSPDYQPKSDGPFPAEGPAKGPASGRCYSDIDCRANGYECLKEGKGNGPGTCVRMDPALGPNGVPKGPTGGGLGPGN